ncbi:substrate-binding periplasmic protein [Spartinivicinus poritis]|uniref:Transporter substrate-binding domain-containing protein n=1 Tax=Spartinivicinus poritis TaxID=2994640 RepID=A0ABT5UDE2_9GAMM|nr:transporter substrate-binding domain-containing protein [Spartinivicinus sp. A2-2]MDE1464396.1 transporter substrate-binding domain-containing protein [Spartinivicinus sp. A2-2]
MKNLFLTFFLCLLSTASSAIDKDFDYLFATDSWPPYLGPELKNGGFFSEIVKEAFRLKGKKVSILYTSWKRAFELTKKGKYEALLGVYYLPEREKFFKYSSVISHSRQYLYSKKSRNITFNSLRELSPYRIGVVRGYHYSKEFNDANYLDRHEEVNTKKIVKLLLIDRLDLIAAEQRVLKYHIDTAFPELRNQYQQHPLQLQNKNLHLVISKKLPNFMQIYEEFEAGFTLMKEEGIDKAIMHEHGFDL